MATNALNAPGHIIGHRPALGNALQGPNDAPSLVFGGVGILDHRLIYNLANSANAGIVVGWYGNGYCVNAVPSALTTTAIAAAQVPVSGTPMTLVSATGAGITKMAASFLCMPSLNTIPVGMLAIDGLPGYQRFGLGVFSAFYDPSKFIGRTVAIASVGNDSAGTFLVAGWDFYGYPQSELITGANAGTATGKKAFKFISSITPGGTMSGSNASAGQSDVYGLPLRADQFGQTSIVYNAAAITANTGFVAADTTTPATTTTGDVRGTYAVQSASNATKRLEIKVEPSIVALAAAAGVAVGLFGVTPA